MKSDFARSANYIMTIGGLNLPTKIEKFIIKFKLSNGFGLMS